MSIFQSDLLRDKIATCAFLNRSVTADGYGGYTTKWVPGATFEAIITENNSTEATVAGIAHKTTFYGVKTERAVPLQFHDVFIRLKDNKTFRIRNADSMTSPDFSTLDMKQLEAEEFDPPEGISPAEPEAQNG